MNKKPKVKLKGSLPREISNINRISMASRENENLDKPTLEETRNGAVAPLTVEKSLGNLENLSNERKTFRKLGLSKLKGYNIERDVRKAVESGNIDIYCNDLVKKLEQSALAQCARVIDRCESVTEQTLAFLREERNVKEHGKNEENESLKAEFDSMSDSVTSLIKEGCSFGDTKKLWNFIKTVMDEDLKAFRENTAEEARNIADTVSDAAKAVCAVKRQKSESDSTGEVTEELAVTQEDENEGNEVLENESDENSEKAPIIEREDKHEIPTPSPPPPVYSSLRDVNVICTRTNANLVKEELNFAVSRLTSEVITSYEQARALQKRVPLSLDLPILDFMQNQEIKKTFFIKEIITRVHEVLSMLIPEVREQQGLDETVNGLWYFLQTYKKYEVHGLSVTRVPHDKIGFLFYILLIFTLTVIALLLSLTVENFALIVFVAVVLIFMLWWWQSVISAVRKNFQVFGRVKKSEKIV